MSAPPEATLAAFLAGLRADSLPAPVRDAARRSLLNILGCVLGGWADGGVRRAAAALRAPGGGAATAVGIGAAPPGLAAYLNALAANVLDFDDQHLETVMHPGSVVVPAALAAAEAEGADGPALLLAVAAGTEAALRVALAAGPEHYSRGFHVTATAGVFGAAVAAGTVLRLDATALLDALGHAASQSGGLVAGLGADSKGFGVGAAARAGLESAWLARAGLRGPPAPVTGRFGFLAVQPGTPRPDMLDGALGTRWHAPDALPKAFPVGVVLHPVVDAALALDMAPAEIDSVALLGHPLLRQRADRPAPRDAREATVSAQHVFAAALLRRRFTPEELGDAARADPAIRALAARVTVGEAPGVSPGGVVLRARARDGRAAEREVPVGSGLPGRPLSDAALAAKVAALAAWGAPWADAAALAAAVNATRPAAALARFLAPGPG